MSTETRDIIDLLAGIEPGSSLDGIRTRRLQARENAQKSYAALFEPAYFGDASTPVAFGHENVEELRSVGLDDAEIVDVINGAAFFNWANRLMLSLGEPTTVVDA